MKKLMLMAVMALGVSVAANAQIGESKSKKIETTYTTTTTTMNVEQAPFKGYKGMFDLGYGIGVGDVESSRIGFSTVHGYQFNPYLFVGAGFGVNYFYDDECVNIPIFADARGTLPLKDNVALFLDFRLGYSAVDVEGFYLSPSVGVRVGRKSAVTFSLGYEYQGCDAIYYDYDSYWGYNYYYGTGNAGAVTFRIGFDW